MLTDQDIKKLTDAQRQTFATKDDIASLKGDITKVESRMATKDDLASLESRMATKDDLASLKTDVTKIESRMATKDDLIELEDRVTNKFSDLQASVDRYLKFTETWHQELTILKGRQDRLTQVLIHKGVVSEQEVTILG